MMDGVRFDRMVRRFGDAASRRHVIAAAVAAAAAGVWAPARAGAVCKKDGGTCDARHSGQCCSGNCDRTGKRRRCKPAPGAEGCTVRDDACTLSGRGRCPQNDDGICVVLDNGRPFCALASACSACQTDADCDRVFQSKGGKCIKHCQVCKETSGGRACVFPEPISSNAGDSRGLVAEPDPDLRRPASAARPSRR